MNELKMKEIKKLIREIEKDCIKNMDLHEELDAVTIILRSSLNAYERTEIDKMMSRLNGENAEVIKLKK
jgi:hypothetical protein